MFQVCFHTCGVHGFGIWIASFAAFRDGVPGALKAVARAVIVGRRCSPQKHEGAGGAAKEERAATGVHARKPSFTHISTADETQTVGWRGCELFPSRTGVRPCDGRSVIHEFSAFAAFASHGSRASSAFRAIRVVWLHILLLGQSSSRLRSRRPCGFTDQLRQFATEFTCQVAQSHGDNVWVTTRSGTRLNQPRMATSRWLVAVW